MTEGVDPNMLVDLVTGRLNEKPMPTSFDINNTAAAMTCHLIGQISKGSASLPEPEYFTSLATAIRTFLSSNGAMS